jgi:hypothetical protein
LKTLFITILAAMVLAASASAGLIAIKQVNSDVVANTDQTGSDRQVPVFDGATNRITNTTVEISSSAVITLPAAVRETGDADVSTTPYTALVTAPWIYVNTSTTSVEIDLPACDSSTDGLILHIREVDSTNDTTIDPNGSETLNGSATTYSFDGEAVDGINLRCKGSGSSQGWWSF